MVGAASTSSAEPLSDDEPVDESINLRRVEDPGHEEPQNAWVYDRELRSRFPGMSLKDIVDQHLVWTRQSPDQPERTQYKVKPASMVGAASASSAEPLSDDEPVDES